MFVRPMHERFTAYLAPRGFTGQLVAELGDATQVRDRLVLAPGAPRPAAWAQNIWLDPRWIAVDSIGDAARKLKAMQRNWALYSVDNHRRAALIEAKLPPVAARPLAFGAPRPAAPLGSWTLWEPGLMLASAACSSAFAHGEVRFEENKSEPPNRAYLKLWELFTLLDERPGPGDLCLDLGSSPGGWSWVLAGLGARVFSVDKAPLAPHIASLPEVEHCLGSGFGLDPRHAGAVDWLFSDMACYPDRLLELVRRWMELGECRRFVCTLKFQADTDHDTARAFAAIPGSRLLHLSCNKHELTWVRL
ncbi:MAG: SAM-dependent methyltransferase [Desulfovibrionaceae bacterium]